jgi:hypothetical protein
MNTIQSAKVGEIKKIDVVVLGETLDVARLPACRKQVDTGG